MTPQLYSNTRTRKFFHLIVDTDYTIRTVMYNQHLNGCSIHYTASTVLMTLKISNRNKVLESPHINLFAGCNYVSNALAAEYSRHISTRPIGGKHINIACTR
jgi:hypothetical protein